MAQLIKDSAQVTVDTWTTLELAEGETPETVALPAGEIIFPFAVWQARQAEIIATHERIGLLIQPDERIEDVSEALSHFALIAVNFPKFVDGRGYSTASLLRQRYNYQGELRAVGDVLHDQLFFMKRVGFDSYALKDGKNAIYALEAAFTPFSDAYQGSTNQPQPFFRRRH
ncbi:DUF934 domain-containing protein [Dechloromonas denitrificans]|uniref:DUF934 domain-containing protein n=1 Tax=Dechloromonas denitrificans TaxID=281362 RepID=UPI001CF91808|nr:DUF934 domain-containing protein [Dechloromonas denitrificans]UCV12707.1 DUF934 domain-containing protein [Dechloromonas denitrificans]